MTARDRYATTWRHTLTVTVGLGSMIGLVGWPLPTAYVLCAATGALALTAGLLRLRGELTTQPDDPDYEPPPARQILWDQGLSENVIDGVLAVHAHELAEQQRREMHAPGRSYDASRWNRCVDMTAAVIDPEARS